MSDNNGSIFDSVLFVGPYRAGKGGIVAVLGSYSRFAKPFHFASTCSHWGHFFSMFVLAGLLLRMPFIRAFSKRRILHVHFASYGSFLRKSMVIRWGKTLGFKIVGHCHGAEFKMFAEKKGKDKIIGVLGKCDVVVALSESWKSFFIDELNCNNVEVSWNPIEPVENPENNVGDRLELLFLGRIGERKGVFDVISTIAQNKQSLEGKIHFAIGGDGDVERLTKAISDNGLNDIVEYVGWISGEDKQRLLRKANVVMLPSYNEGLPIVLLEAMAYGKGIIATAVGGIPEIVSDGENGIIVEAGNHADILRAITTYVNDPTLAARHGEKSLKLIEKSYPYNVKCQLEGIYSNII